MKFVPASVTRKVSTTILKGKKNSPTILFATGVVGVVTTTVLASRATLKLDEVLSEAESQQGKAALLHSQNRSDYSDKDYNRDVALIQGKTALNVVKLYAPAIVVGALSIACLTGSHRILSKRNAALTAAYVSLESTFNEYRRRVAEDIGEERERDIRYNVSGVPIRDHESGKVAVVKRAGESIYSPYAKLFGPDNKHWEDLPGYNQAFLSGQQQFANDRLRVDGFVLLNDVYTALGLPRTTEGCVVGWVWDGDGDNYIDFGFSNWSADNYLPDHLQGKNGGIWLDFNVDGVIYDKI